MELEGILNASLALEKRIATDKMLRRYFSTLWKKTEGKGPMQTPSSRPSSKKSKVSQVTLNFPPEMCELLELASNATGKTPSEILEECFVNYYLKQVAPPSKG